MSNAARKISKELVKQGVTSAFTGGYDSFTANQKPTIPNWDRLMVNNIFKNKKRSNIIRTLTIQFFSDGHRC